MTGLLASAPSLILAKTSPDVPKSWWPVLVMCPKLPRGGHPGLCRLVAYLSCAHVEAMNRGLAQQLAEFSPINGLVADALTYCDMTTTPDGNATDVDSRLHEIVDRYSDGHVVAESIKAAAPEIRATVSRVAAALAERSPGESDWL